MALGSRQPARANDWRAPVFRTDYPRLSVSVEKNFRAFADVHLFHIASDTDSVEILPPGFDPRHAISSAAHSGDSFFRSMR
jgi:hypothetical protein